MSTSNVPSNDNESDNHDERSFAGRLIPLRTKAEALSTLTLTKAYVVEIPLKSANSALKAVDHVIAQQAAVNLQHLRRFAKSEYLPAWLREPFDTLKNSVPQETNPSAVEGVDGPKPFPIQNHDLGKIRALDAHSPSEDQSLHFLICAASVVSPGEISSILSSITAFQEFGNFSVRTTLVPAYPPTSEEQARQWSHDYWPTVYKKHNPNGPHPSMISKAEDEIRPSVGKWMTLAAQAGLDSSETSIGEAIGAVVVDRSTGGEIVAAVAAGDARWNGYPMDSRNGSGNVMAHAVMRAIGLVARKRRMLLQERDEILVISKTFLDHPLTQTEQGIFIRDTLKPGGYLCTDLEIYLTHEPCVMCSMAILHSRFTKVIFGRRMPRTGGLTTEATDDCEEGLRYGLFWLPELNWKLLAWQWIEEDNSQFLPLDAEIHA